MDIAQQIDQHWKATKNEPPRPHLGASILGTECERALWYGFRWATLVIFEGRLLRLFERGHAEEPSINRNLKAIGMTVWERDPETGKQFTFSDHGGHFGGSLDGIGQMPDTAYAMVLEFKTSALKGFDDMVKNGVQKSKPLHYAQMQKYMGWAGLTKALYIMVCKNDDRLHTEIVEYDAVADKALTDKALRVIEAQRPPARISDSPSHFECRFCDHWSVCHDLKPARMSCRTCISATPLTTGEGGWHCDQYDTGIPEHVQRSGCPDHRYIPDLLPFGENPQADGREIKYQIIGTDRSFWNGTKGEYSYDSMELQELTIDTVGDPGIEAMREAFDGRVVRSGPITAEEIPF